MGQGSRVTMLPLCACLLAPPMKPPCSIEQGGVTQPHSDGNITRPIANILYGKVVKRAPILPPSGSNIGNPNKFKPKYINLELEALEYYAGRKEILIARRSRSKNNISITSTTLHTYK